MTDEGEETGARKDGAPAAGATKRPHELLFITLLKKTQRKQFYA